MRGAMNEPPTRQTLGHNLKKRYKARTVVEDVSFEVKSGEVVGLLGPNGAGKTTCFYMIVGLVPADGGEVYIDDARLTHLPMHSRARQGSPTCRRKPRSSAN
jgi:lipopolysaccharide export system ATP-binding protein